MRVNQRPFRKREGSRATLFAQLDRPALKPLPGHALSVRRMENRSRQHRLPHRSGAALLQRAIRAGAPGVGRTPDGGNGGDPTPRGAGRLACPLRRGRKSHDADRAQAQVAPEVPGAHALAADRRGPADRTLHWRNWWKQSWRPSGIRSRAFGRVWGFCGWRKRIRPSAWKRQPGDA